MAFDKPTRNRLASFVSEARNLIADEFTQQFQSIYGISEKGEVTPLEQLGHLDDAGLSTATLLRERIEYLVRTHPGRKRRCESRCRSPRARAGVHRPKPSRRPSDGGEARSYC